MRAQLRRWGCVSSGATNPRAGRLPGEALTREERRSLAIHRAVAAKLAADPVGVLAHARRNLSVMRRANEDGAADAVVRGVGTPPAWPAWRAWSKRWCRTAEHARDLRQVTPFAGVLSDEERRAIYAADRAALSECDAISSSTSSARPVTSLGVDEVIVIGSQAILASVPFGLPPEATRSVEADILPIDDRDETKADLIDGCAG